MVLLVIEVLEDLQGPRVHLDQWDLLDQQVCKEKVDQRAKEVIPVQQDQLVQQAQ